MSDFRGRGRGRGNYPRRGRGGPRGGYNNDHIRNPSSSFGGFGSSPLGSTNFRERPMRPWKAPLQSSSYSWGSPQQQKRFSPRVPLMPTPLMGPHSSGLSFNYQRNMPRPMRSISPLPGSEEAREKAIAEASARIKEQLNLDNSFSFVNQYNYINKQESRQENKSDECEKKTKPEPVRRKVRKPSNVRDSVNVQELRNKIITQFTSMSKGRIQNLVNNPGSTKYDVALSHLVRDMRLNLSSELRTMYSTRDSGRENEAVIAHFNNLVPDLGVELASLPDTVVDELSNILQLDGNLIEDVQNSNFTTDTDGSLIEPEQFFKQAERMLFDTDNISPGDIGNLDNFPTNPSDCSYVDDSSQSMYQMKLEHLDNPQNDCLPDIPDINDSNDMSFQNNTSDSYNNYYYNQNYSNFCDDFNDYSNDQINNFSDRNEERNNSCRFSADSGTRYDPLPYNSNQNQNFQQNIGIPPLIPPQTRVPLLGLHPGAQNFPPRMSTSQNLPSTSQNLLPSNMPSTQSLLSSTMPSNPQNLLPSTMPSTHQNLLPSTMPSTHQNLLPSTMTSTPQNLLSSTMPSTPHNLLSSTMPSNPQNLLPSTLTSTPQNLLPSTMTSSSHLSSIATTMPSTSQLSSIPSTSQMPTPFIPQDMPVSQNFIPHFTPQIPPPKETVTTKQNTDLEKIAPPVVLEQIPIPIPEEVKKKVGKKEKKKSVQDIVLPPCKIEPPAPLKPKEAKKDESEVDQITLDDDSHKFSGFVPLRAAMPPELPKEIIINNDNSGLNPAKINEDEETRKNPKISIKFKDLSKLTETENKVNIFDTENQKAEQKMKEKEPPPEKKVLKEPPPDKKVSKEPEKKVTKPETPNPEPKRMSAEILSNSKPELKRTLSDEKPNSTKPENVKSKLSELRQQLLCDKETVASKSSTPNSPNSEEYNSDNLSEGTPEKIKRKYRRRRRHSSEERQSKEKDSSDERNSSIERYSSKERYDSSRERYDNREKHSSRDRYEERYEVRENYGSHERSNREKYPHERRRDYKRYQQYQYEQMRYKYDKYKEYYSERDYYKMKEKEYKRRKALKKARKHKSPSLKSDSSTSPVEKQPLIPKIPQHQVPLEERLKIFKETHKENELQAKVIEISDDDAVKKEPDEPPVKKSLGDKNIDRLDSNNLSIDDRLEIGRNASPPREIVQKILNEKRKEDKPEKSEKLHKTPKKNPHKNVDKSSMSTLNPSLENLTLSKSSIYARTNEYFKNELLNFNIPCDSNQSSKNSESSSQKDQSEIDITSPCGQSSKTKIRDYFVSPEQFDSFHFDNETTPKIKILKDEIISPVKEKKESTIEIKKASITELIKEPVIELKKEPMIELKKETMKEMKKETMKEMKKESSTEIKKESTIEIKKGSTTELKKQRKTKEDTPKSDCSEIVTVQQRKTKEDAPKSVCTEIVTVPISEKLNFIISPHIEVKTSEPIPQQDTLTDNLNLNLTNSSDIENLKKIVDLTNEISNPVDLTETENKVKLNRKIKLKRTRSIPEEINIPKPDAKNEDKEEQNQDVLNNKTLVICVEKLKCTDLKATYKVSEDLKVEIQTDSNKIQTEDNKNEDNESEIVETNNDNVQNIEKSQMECTQIENGVEDKGNECEEEVEKKDNLETIDNNPPEELVDSESEKKRTSEIIEKIPTVEQVESEPDKTTISEIIGKNPPEKLVVVEPNPVETPEKLEIVQSKNVEEVNKNIKDDKHLDNQAKTKDKQSTVKSVTPKVKSNQKVTLRRDKHRTVKKSVDQKTEHSVKTKITEDIKQDEKEEIKQVIIKEAEQQNKSNTEKIEAIEIKEITEKKVEENEQKTKENETEVTDTDKEKEIHINDNIVDKEKVSENLVEIDPPLEVNKSQENDEVLPEIEKELPKSVTEQNKNTEKPTDLINPEKINIEETNKHPEAQNEKLDKTTSKKNLELKSKHRKREEKPSTKKDIKENQKLVSKSVHNIDTNKHTKADDKANDAEKDILNNQNDNAINIVQNKNQNNEVDDEPLLGFAKDCIEGKHHNTKKHEHHHTEKVENSDKDKSKSQKRRRHHSKESEKEIKPDKKQEIVHKKSKVEKTQKSERSHRHKSERNDRSKRHDRSKSKETIRLGSISSLSPAESNTLSASLSYVSPMTLPLSPSTQFMPTLQNPVFNYPMTPMLPLPPNMSPNPPPTIPKTRESILNRMMVIDMEIQKLMQEKWNLYKELQMSDMQRENSEVGHSRENLDINNSRDDSDIINSRDNSDIVQSSETLDFSRSGESSEIQLQMPLLIKVTDIPEKCDEPSEKHETPPILTESISKIHLKPETSSKTHSKPSDHSRTSKKTHSKSPDRVSELKKLRRSKTPDISKTHRRSTPDRSKKIDRRSKTPDHSKTDIKIHSTPDLEVKRSRSNEKRSTEGKKNEKHSPEKHESHLKLKINKRTRRNTRKVLQISESDEDVEHKNSDKIEEIKTEQSTKTRRGQKSKEKTTDNINEDDSKVLASDLKEIEAQDNSEVVENETEEIVSKEKSKKGKKTKEDDEIKPDIENEIAIEIEKIDTESEISETEKRSKRSKKKKTRSKLKKETKNDDPKAEESPKESDSEKTVPPIKIIDLIQPDEKKNKKRDRKRTRTEITEHSESDNEFTKRKLRTRGNQLKDETSNSRSASEVSFLDEKSDQEKRKKAKRKHLNDDTDTDTDNVVSTSKIDDDCVEVTSTSDATVEINTEVSEVAQNEGIFCSSHNKSILYIQVFGNEFLAASEDGCIYRYSLTTGQLNGMYSGHIMAVTCLYIPKDTTGNPIFFSGSLDCYLKCFRLDTYEQTNSVAVEQAIQCMDSAWGYIFLGTYDGLLFIYDIKKNLLQDTSLTVASATVLMLKATTEGCRQVLILASRKREIMVRDAFTGLLLRTMCEEQKPTIYSLLLDRSYVYCGTSDKGILVLDFNSGDQLRVYNAGKGVVCMSVYRSLLFAGCYDGMIYIYNTQNFEHIKTIKGPGEGMLLSLAIVNDYIIAGTKKDHLLKIWKIPQDILQDSH